MARAARGVLGLLCVSILCAGANDDWRRRKEAVISTHPLFGRKIERSELTGLVNLVRAAQRLPEDDGLAIAYLIQGEEDVEEKEEAMWRGQNVAFVNTFRTQRRDALFFPNSLLAEGRNVLMAAAAVCEFRRGRRFAYYALLDADAIAVPTWPQALPAFEAFLEEWQPAVGVPAFGEWTGRADSYYQKTGIKPSEEPQCIFHYDHIFLAVHAQAANLMLPYDTTYDHTCAWTSQWEVSLLSTALFRHHTLLLPAFRVENPTHGKYPKDDCIAAMVNCSTRWREAAPQHVKSCFPNPVKGVVMMKDGQPKHFSYLSAGEARRKGDFNYSSSKLVDSPTCDDAEFAESANQPYHAEECRGCDVAMTFLVLQLAVAASPRSDKNWNSLGTWFWKFATHLDLDNKRAQIENYSMAAACFAVARRLRRAAKKPPHLTLEKNADLVDKYLEANSVATIDGSPFWADNGRIAASAIMASLTPAETTKAGLDTGWLISQETLADLMQFLLSAPE